MAYHTIYTDNARTFHAANFELSALWEQLTASKTYQFLAHTGITWKFIAPRAAWWGGWWATTRLPPDGFSLNLLFEHFSKNLSIKFKFH